MIGVHVDSASLAAMAVAATVSAGMSGMCLGWRWETRRAHADRRKCVRAKAGARDSPVSESLSAKNGWGFAIGLAADVSHRLSLGVTRPLCAWISPVWAERWLGDHARKAGMGQSVSAEGFVETAARLALGMACAAFVAGAILSTELAFAGLVIGFVGGLASLPRAVRRAERERAKRLECDLSQMLEVVALGLRSGLSFDRSFELYGVRFHSPFARECAQAQRMWTCGLVTREEALRDLASAYDSSLLARVVENTVRSLRFGSSLVASFEEAAAEARAVHRAHVEERVAKAPVKMMVPTGALILPAMLLLVMGPVLLELMEGF